ncbi:MAG: ATP-grasp domain-containing protein [Gammaproteobacteria bacterium]|nr:ATP-grasp domain-containing protein [Gammaproteobacteria bacterium]
MTRLMTRSNERALAVFLARCGETPRVPAVVLDSSVNGLSYVRSLSRKGIPVLCLDARRGIASKSRFGTFIALEGQRGDDIVGEQAATRLLERLNEAGIEPVAFGAADAWQVYLARLSNAGCVRARTLLPSASIMDQIVDKQAQYEAASALGIPVARFANAEEVFRGGVDWETFPAIIKPRWSHTGRTAIGGKAVRVQCRVELMNAFASLDREADVSAYLVQDIIPGGDSCLYAYLGCYDSKGEEVAWLIKRKLRQCPPGFGDGSFDVTCANDGVAQAARRLLTGIGYRGLVGVEFKQDPESGELTLIEINPRTVSTNQLAIRAGVDFPWMAYQLILGEALDLPPESADGLTLPYAINVHHANEEREFRSFLLRRRAGEVTAIAWLREVLSAQSYAFFDWGDPAPFLWSLTSGLGRRIFSRSRTDAGTDPAA